MSIKHLILGRSMGLSIIYNDTQHGIERKIEVVEPQLKQLGYSATFVYNCLKNFNYDAYYSTLPKSTKTKLIIKGLLTRRRKGIVKGQFKF